MTGLEILAAVGSVASGFIGAMGAIQAANAQAAAAEYQGKLQERNAAIIQQQTSAEMEDQRRENRRRLSALRVAYGASGFEMAGSPLDVLEDTAIEGELDVSKIEYQGKLRALEQTDNAELSRMEAKSAKKAGAIGAVGALVGGVTQAGTSLMRS